MKYVDENGSEFVCTDYKKVSEVEECAGYSLSNGWYVVDKDVAFNEHRMTIVGDVNLILCDGATLNLYFGIRCGDQYNNGQNSLTIWSQRKRTGKLECEGFMDNAAIGGDDDENCGTINIHGGNIRANGAFFASGIGGGEDGDGGTIRIYGGKISANGYKGGAGIGGGDEGNSGDILIYGGNIYAKSYRSYIPFQEVRGAGIGSGDGGRVNIIHILGGERIECHGYHAIGSGKDGKDGSVVLGDNIEVEGFSWNDRYNALSYANDLVLRTQ